MINKLVKGFFFLIALVCYNVASAQLQTCPTNINFADGTLTHWFAYTGTFIQNTNRAPSIKQAYDTISTLPSGTIGAVTIPEYGGSSMIGIEVLTSPTIDPFGGFTTLPNINGYQYNYAIKIGSTSVSSVPGGFFRGVGYVINVPVGTGPFPKPLRKHKSL